MRAGPRRRAEARAEAGAEAGGAGASLSPLFVNVAAGRQGDAVYARLEAACRHGAVRWRIRPVAAAQLGVAVGAAAGRHAVIGVAGGDGSQRTAAAALAGRSAVLVPFPTGTLNHFARRHGVATIEAAAAAAGGAVRSVTLGVLDDEVFLNTATIGYYAEVVRRRERLRPWLGKWPAALVAIATLLLGRPRLEVELEIDGRRIRRTTALVWIGVGWGSFPRAHEAADRRAAPDLEVAVLRAQSRAAMLAFGLRLVPRLFRSERPLQDPALEIHHTRSVVIRAARRLDATLDGERFRFEPPVFVSVQDDALRLAVPPPLAERTAGA